MRHGCLTILIGTLSSTATVANEAVPVAARVFDIDYAFNEASLPLSSVQLWYTADRGQTWQQYGFDEDGQSPITFHAPNEGLFGFFFVLTNATGASGGAPTPSTEPHSWALVDYTPPVIQLHPLRQTTLLGQRVVQIRWTAIDAHLDPRPIEIQHRKPPAESWHPVTADPMVNTGRYDWRLPDDLIGTVAVRLIIRDQGGHVVESEPQVVEVTATTVADVAAIQTNDNTAARNSASISAEARERAARLFRDGLAHRDRGEYREGVARMREAVRLDPDMTEAFAEMAEMLYRMGDFDRALKAYEITLKQAPKHRSALQGLAMVYRQKNDYESAASLLRTILTTDPKDAEVWMNLGDVAVFQGDEILARQFYQRAIEADPAAAQVIEDAQKRLALMTKVSRTYQ